MDKTPEPVAKVAAVEMFALAVVNLLAVSLDWSGEFVAAVNGVVMGAVVVLGAFWLRPAVTPVKGLHERLSSLSTDTTPDIP